jgi:hypothetical protein
MPYTILDQWRCSMGLKIELDFENILISNGAQTKWKASINLGNTKFVSNTWFTKKSAAKNLCALYVLYRLNYTRF